MTLKSRVIKLESTQVAICRPSTVLVDVRPGQGWNEALYLAMLSVKGPATYIRKEAA